MNPSFPKIIKSKIFVIIIALVIIGVIATFYFVKEKNKNTEKKEGINNTQQINEEEKPLDNNQNNPTEEKKEIPLMSEEEAKQYFHATEVVSNNLWESILLNDRTKIGDSDIFTYDLEIEFWTESNCPYDGTDKDYKIPANMIFSDCEKGEIGSHGGCPTCEMSKIKLIPCGSYTNCSVDELYSKVGKIINSKKIIKSSSLDFYTDTKFDKEFHGAWGDSIAGLVDFINNLDLKNIIKGDYSKEYIEKIFTDSGFNEDNRFQINTGTFDSKYSGNVALISFSYEGDDYILMLYEDSRKKLLNVWPYHYFENKPLMVGNKFLFEADFVQGGGSCAGWGGTQYSCRIQDTNFICYETGKKGGNENCSFEQWYTSYETKDVNGDEENELMVNLISRFPYKFYDHSTSHYLDTQCFQSVYKLNSNNDLELLSSGAMQGEIKKITIND